MFTRSRKHALEQMALNTHQYNAQQSSQTHMHGYVFHVPDYVGGGGGYPFDHREELAARGLKLGLGGVLLTDWFFDGWMVLGSTRSIYRSLTNPDIQPYATLKQGFNKGYGSFHWQHQPGACIEALAFDYGGPSTYAAGAICLNEVRLQIKTQSSNEEPRQSVFVASGAYPPRNTPHALYLPKGVNLAGLTGRSGDSVDALGFYLCPAIPPNWSPKSHHLCPPPFRDQVRALMLSLYHQRAVADVMPPQVAFEVARHLFQITFLAADAGGDPETDVVARWMQGVCSDLRTETRVRVSLVNEQPHDVSRHAVEEMEDDDSDESDESEGSQHEDDSDDSAESDEASHGSEGEDAEAAAEGSQGEQMDDYDYDEDVHIMG